MKVKYLVLVHFYSNEPKYDKHDAVNSDASGIVEGKSFNSYLLSGPDLLTDLPCILIKLRERKYGVGDEVENIFHQILIKKSNRDAQRCL